jgi:hypothetical protein
MRTPFIRLVFLFAVLAVTFGCGLFQKGGQTRATPSPARASKDVVPGWIERFSGEKGQICAVGYSSPTYYQNDCVKNAAENGRGHLAETFSISMKTVTIDYSDGRSGPLSQDTFVEGFESMSQTVLEGSEIKAQWVDRDGVRGDRQGCYVRVCVERQKPIMKMLENVQKTLPPKQVSKVRENAESAFDKLEQEETRNHKP